MRNWYRRLRRLLGAGRLDREVHEELEHHIAMEIEDRLGAGVTPAEARQGARRDFGSVERWREEARTAYRLLWLDELRQDLRYGVRVLRSSPSFALAAIATLAIAIGANATVFGTVRAVLLRPLSYPAPEQLVRLYEYHQQELTAGGPARGTISYPNFADMRGGSTLWQSAAAYDEWSVTLTGEGDAERHDGAAVDWSWFDVLGVQPAAGRFFSAADSITSDGRLIVLEWSLWQTRFGGSPDIIGRTITLNGFPYEVVGIAPRDLENPGLQGDSFDPPRMWRPPLPHFATNSRGSRSFTALIRLQDGVELASAQAEVDGMQAALVEQFPENNAGRIARLVPLSEDMTGTVRSALLLTLAAVGVVRLVACANVANLLLLRASARAREVALRSALGASRRRVIRQLVTETFVLAVLGGAGGILLAWVMLPVLTTVAAEHLPRSAGIRMDGTVLLVTLMLTFGVGALFGLAPVLEMSRVAPGTALRSGGRVTGSGARARHLLLGMQVALCIIALASAGLLTRTLLQLRMVDPGLDAANVLTLELRPSDDAWPIERYDVLHDELRRRVGALAGVRTVAATSILPMSGGFNGVGYTVQGEPAPADGASPTAEARAVTSDFFDALRIPVLAGRPFTSDDRTDTTPVIIVSRSVAERHFGSAEAAVGRALVRNDVRLLIVGVVADVHHFTLDSAPDAALYMPEPQAPGWMRYPIQLVVRSAMAPESLVPAIRSIARDIDPRMPMSRVRRMDQVIGDTYDGQRSRSLLFSAFAVITLLLATVGVYGTVAYDVAGRRQEIGVRMALGSSRGGVAYMLLKHSLRPVVIGALAGCVAALGAGRLLAGMLFNVSAADPVALIAAAALMLGTAALAAWWPAQRASGVAPGSVLRED